MPFITWNETMSVGIAAFDEHHRQLIALLNQLHDAMLSGHSAEVLVPVLVSLIEYTETHFAAEEEAMARANFPGLARHREEHEAMRWEVLELKARMEQGGEELLSVEILTFLKTWLTEHIQSTDKQYTEFFAQSRQL